MKIFECIARAGTASTDLTVEVDMKTRFASKNINALLKNVPPDILKPENISLKKVVAGLEKTVHTYTLNNKMSKIKETIVFLCKTK